MILDQQIANRSELGILRKIAKNTALAASVFMLGLWGLYSSLETYQQERLKSSAVVHLVAMAPSGMLEPYQEERIQRALKSDEPSD